MYLNTDINNLGRLESLSLDLNVGESILSHKIDYLDNTHLYDAYLSIGYSSFDEAVKVNEFNAKVDDYSLYAKGDLELNYDTSGRVRIGPAPKNLDVPPYVILNDTTIKIG